MAVASLIALGGVEAKAQTAPVAPVTIEAENMSTKTTGGGYNGLWNIWSNGYIANSVQFATSGTYTFNIIASGTVAGGIYPTMVLRIDGQDKATFSVNSTTMKTFSASVSVGAGTHAVAIAFTNDAIISGQDRNLLVDKVGITAPTSSATPAPTATAAPAPTPATNTYPTVPATVEAESFATRTTGEAFNGLWGLWSNGYIEQSLNFPSSGSYDVKVTGYGMLSGGIGPNMDIRLDGTRVAGQILSSTSMATYTFRINASAGVHKLAVAFTNDANVNGQDRNLILDKVAVVAASGTLPTPTPVSAATPVPTATPVATPTPTPTPTRSPAGDALFTDMVFSPTSFWYTPIPASAPLHPNSANFVKEFLRQRSTYYNTVNVNTNEYASPVYDVPAGVATVTVKEWDCQGKGYSDPNLAAQWSAVPIPSYALPAQGTDGEMTVYQASTDTLWEFWVARKSSGQWQACWGGRMQNVSKSSGIWTFPYGTTATSLPFLGGQITAEEIKRGEIRHVIGISLVDIEHYTIFSWPAQRSDGSNPSGVPNRIAEGQRFRLNPNINVDALNIHPVAKIIAKAAQKYGFVVWDRAGAISLRAQAPISYTVRGMAAPYPSLFSPKSNYNVLDGFPWDQLQFLPMNYGKP